MTNQIHHQNQRPKQPQLSIPAQGRFQPRPFVMQTQKATQGEQPDLKKSLIQAEQYSHHLERVSKPQVSQPKMEIEKPVQLARKRKQNPATAGNSTGQTNRVRKRPNLTINTNPSGKSPHSRREAAGYKNPSHDHGNMMPLYEQAAVSPQDPSRTKKDWLYSPSRRFYVHSPTHTAQPQIVQGHSNTVMGHKPDAAQHWNTIGHKQTRKANQQHNKETSSYHGLEDARASAASGSKTDRYQSPSPSIGSHPSHFDVRNPDFNPRAPWTHKLRESDGKGGWNHVKYDPKKNDYV
ncbi:hypothetical protein IQ247_20745 [Plectonema cf. radiosum LEGE 06105]|uniref:Uncharacterized protein n=1 Tax=Plectonema cf. radiosum LEGE 06105 TaxID=945769 RepID=A0A8J7K398_9CYAN|nr:hypothetical protein [Plectonema radiosum]MBE9215062.1 hypothetical protein [Plectonema cf. radiosum LEGE 06105]